MNCRRYILTAIALLVGITAFAQRFSVGTNFVDWLSLGTINAEASVAVSQHASLHVGAELNPWTYAAGNQQKEFQARQNSYWAGARWWPWHVYSGWWVGGDVRYSIYNLGGVFKRETEEGDAYGAGAYGGYSIMLGPMWNLDLGVGVWGGYKKYVKYSCPVCGPKLEEGEKVFFLPDARIALQLIF